MRESAVQRGIKTAAERAGWWVLKLNLFGIRGIPDLLCVREGAYLWIEVKRPGETVRPLQEKMHKIMRRYGMVIFVFDNVEDSKLLLVP